MTDFPTIMYRVPGPHKNPRGGTYAYKGASDPAEFDVLLARGWFATYEDAKGVKVKPVEKPIDEVSGATRDELEAKAQELNVSYDGRTSDKKLAERIATALEE